MAAHVGCLVVRQAAAERQAMQMNQLELAGPVAGRGGRRAGRRPTGRRPEYAGETWTIPAEELAGDDGAVVRIQVEAIAGQPQRRSVRVEADYPDAPEHRCRQMKQIVVDRDAIAIPSRRTSNETANYRRHVMRRTIGTSPRTRDAR